MAAAGGLAAVREGAAAGGVGDDLAGEYLGRLRRRFDRAASAAGLRVRDLEIAGLRLRLKFAGEAIREVLLGPFEHLAVEEGEADSRLSISVFDTATSGIEAPPPAWEPPEAPPGTNPVARLRSGRACVLAAAGTGAITTVDVAAGEAIFHLPDAGRIPAGERAAPLRDALQLLMAQNGRWMTHAGAVGRDGRGVLLVGRGGSGKSTLALSCALAGMEIVADDYLLLESEPLRAHAMQSTAKLTEDGAARLGLDAGLIDPAGFAPTLEGPAKALVQIPDLAAGPLTRRLQVAAVVAPTLRPSPPAHIAGNGGFGDARPVLRVIPAAQGLRAVAPSTVVQSGFGGEAALAALANLVRRVPSYSLELSPDPEANADAVDRLVGELG
jgi:hypothetical protein